MGNLPQNAQEQSIRPLHMESIFAPYAGALIVLKYLLREAGPEKGGKPQLYRNFVYFNKFIVYSDTNLIQY